MTDAVVVVEPSALAALVRRAMFYEPRRYARELDEVRVRYAKRLSRWQRLWVATTEAEELDAARARHSSRVAELDGLEQLTSTATLFADGRVREVHLNEYAYRRLKRWAELPA